MRAGDLAPAQFSEFMFGGARASAFASPMAKRTAWFEHRDEFAAAAPGWRPAGFWDVEAPMIGPLLLIGEKVYRDVRGNPRPVSWCACGELHPDGLLHVFEGQEAWLRRHKLLSADEEAELAAHARIRESAHGHPEEDDE